MADSWFNNDSQFNIFQSSLERSLLIVKYSMSKRMEASLADLNKKYDGQKGASLEADVNKLGDTSFEVADYLTRVDAGLRRMNDIRTELFAAKDALNTNSAEAFDHALNAINWWVGRSLKEPDSLIANPTNNRGSWTAEVDVVSAAGETTEVRHTFLGTDYALQLDPPATTVMVPDSKGEKLVGGPDGEVALDNVKLVSMNGDAVTIEDTATGKQYSGTLKRAGVGVLHAWGYDNLTTDEGKARARADIDLAIRALAKAENQMTMTSTALARMKGGVEAQMEAKTDEYKKVMDEELTAKQAEARAIKARFDMATNSLALTTGSATKFIYQMFRTSPTYEKKDITGILMDSVKGS